MPNGFCWQINSLIFPSFFVIEKYGACNFGIMLAEPNLPVGTNSILYIWGRGWRSGESKRLPPVWPDFKSQCRAIFGLSLLLALSFAPRGFSPGTPVFRSSQKPTFPNSNFARNGKLRTTMWMYYLWSENQASKEYSAFQVLKVWLILSF